MIKEEYKYAELTAKVIACARAVHRELGSGFQEIVYQKALAVELANTGIAYKREFEMPVFYKQHQIGSGCVDFLLHGVMSVELMALTDMEDAHLAQGINYLKAYNLEVGLLINFGAKSLQFKRLINGRFKKAGVSEDIREN